MKIYLCLIASAAWLCGCEKSGSDSVLKSTNDMTSPLTAPSDYLGALNKGKTAAEKTVDTSSISKAIQMFNVENGKNPNSLQELVDEKFLPALPKAPYGMELKYDPASGKVSVVPKPQ